MALTQKYSIMCDDVRQENNGKFIVIGMYINNMTVTQLPVTLPSLHFFNLLEADRLGSYMLRAKVENAETGRLLAQAMVMIQANVAPKLPAAVVVGARFPNVQFDRAGSYTFTLTVEGEREPIVIMPFDLVLVIPVAPPQQQQGIM